MRSCLRILTPSVWVQSGNKNCSEARNFGAILVPVVGLEPTRYLYQRILSFARYLELGVL